MVGEILNRFKNDIEAAQLVPSSGGIFEVRLGGETVYSKKEEDDRFPNPGESVERILQRITAG